MSSVSTYLRWLSILCGIMACLGIGVFIIGYKDPSFGRVATVIALIAGSIILGVLSHRERMREASSRLITKQ